MSKMTGVFQRHARTCKRGPRCGCPWAYMLELPSGGGPRRQIGRSGFPSQKTAAEARREAQDAYKDKSVDVQRGRITLGEWLDEWLVLRQQAHDDDPLSPSTLSNYKMHIEEAWKPRLGQVKMRDLTTTDIRNVLDSLKVQGPSGRPLSKGSVQRYKATLSSALTWAHAEGIIASNPLERLKPKRKKAKKVNSRPKWIAGMWTLEDWQKFSEGISGDRLAPLYRLAVDSGMRRGELCGLRWRDVDLDRGTITVSVALVHVGNEVVETTPKTDAGTDRTVHLTDGTIAVLKAWRATQMKERLKAGDAWAGTDRVFTDALGNHLVPKSVYQHFVRKVAALGLPRMRFHDLRHLSATIGGAVGESPKEMSVRLGHTDPAFTQRVYQHVWDQQAKEGASKRGSLLDTGTDA